MKAEARVSGKQRELCYVLRILRTSLINQSRRPRLCDLCVSTPLKQNHRRSVTSLVLGCPRHSTVPPSELSRALMYPPPPSRDGGHQPGSSELYLPTPPRAPNPNLCPTGAPALACASGGGGAAAAAARPRRRGCSRRAARRRPFRSCARRRSPRAARAWEGHGRRSTRRGVRSGTPPGGCRQLSGSKRSGRPVHTRSREEAPSAPPFRPGGAARPVGISISAIRPEGMPRRCISSPRIACDSWLSTEH